MPIRWRCPPENSWGYLRMCSGFRPTAARTSRTRFTRSCERAIRCTASGSPTMDATVIRGLSDEYGSWKMICMSRRRAFISRRDALTTLTASAFTAPSCAIRRLRNTICPAVGSTRRRIARPAVVFPHPLSPTSPSVSRSWMRRSIPSTALTSPRRRRRPFCRTGKCFVSPVTSSRASSVVVSGITSTLGASGAPDGYPNSGASTPPRAPAPW